MAELKTALTSTITSDSDTRDYDFGRVGNTNYVYINNEKSMKIPYKEKGRILKNYKSNDSRYYKSGNDYGNDGFYSSKFPYCFMNKTKWGSIFTNTENCSNIGIFQEKCINGATWEWWSEGNYPEDDKDFLNSSEYQTVRNYDNTNYYSTTLYGKNFYWDPLWWKNCPNSIQYGSEPWTRLKFPLKDMLDIPDDQVDAWLQENQITRVNGYCKIHCVNNNTDGYYPLSFCIRTVCSLDESGWNRKWDYPIMYWSADTTNASEDLAQNVNFEIPIINGQKNIFLEIIGFTHSNAQWLFSQSIPWNLEVKFTELYYRPKFQGNIFTAPNDETLFCTGTANTTLNNTVVNFLGENVSNQQVWPKEYYSSNVIKLNSSVTSTIIKSNPTNTNTAFEIYLNWLTGEYQGYYQKGETSYPLASTQGEKFDVGNDSSFTLNFGTSTTNKLTIKPQSKTITELPVVISEGKAELTIKNYLNNVTALIDRQNIENRLEEIQTAISKTQSSIDRVYIAKEVGDYYITESNINPASRFGGTWKLVSSPDNNPVVLIASGSTTGTYGAFWRLYSDGYLIQYSRDTNVQLTNITFDKTITYPISFANTDYHLGNVGFVIARYGEQYVKKLVNGFTSSSGTNSSATDSWVAQGQCNSTTYNSYLKEYKQKHPEHFAYKWQKISNDKDPSNPQSFSTQSANITYNVALEQFPVGYIYRKDVDPTTPPTLEDNWIPCDGGTVLINGTTDADKNIYAGEKYKELIKLLTGSDAAISATLPLLNQVAIEQNVTYDGATLIKQICYDKKASTEHNVSLINFYSNGLLEQIGYRDIKSNGSLANEVIKLAYPYRGPTNYTIQAICSDQRWGVYNTSDLQTKGVELGWGACTKDSFRIGTDRGFGDGNAVQRVNFKTSGFCDQTTFNALFPENKRPKYWIKAANSVRQNSLPNLIDHSLNIHYYGENNKGLAQNLKNLTALVSDKHRGSDNFFLDSGNLNIDPNKFKKSIITIKAYDSARNCIMYRFDIDWQLKTLQFFTDDYTTTKYLSAGINSPWAYNLTTNNKFMPIEGDTTRYLEFDNKGYIKTLPLPPFSNINTLDVMCENYKC